MHLGDYEVTSLFTGNIKLDGGAMFGVVPRVLWSKKMPPDEENRVKMSMNTLLIRGRGRNILVDTGSGNKEGRGFEERFGLSGWPLLDMLAEKGLSPADIDVVFNTHLHFDHAGGNTLVGVDGRTTATFPNARYIVQRREYEDATSANERNRASYFDRNYVPLRNCGRMDLIEGETEIAPGLFALPLPGHTAGMQGLLVDSGGAKGLYLADCIPTSHHLPIPWIMAYDLYPLTTLETKKRILPKAAKEGWVLFFEHDPEVPVARVEEVSPGRFEAAPVGG